MKLRTLMPRRSASSRSAPGARPGVDELGAGFQLARVQLRGERVDDLAGHLAACAATRHCRKNPPSGVGDQQVRRQVGDPPELRSRVADLDDLGHPVEQLLGG